MINISDNIWLYKSAITYIEKRYDDNRWYLHLNNGEVILISDLLAQQLISQNVVINS